MLKLIESKYNVFHISNDPQLRLPELADKNKVYWVTFVFPKTVKFLF